MHPLVIPLISPEILHLEALVLETLKASQTHKVMILYKTSAVVLFHVDDSAFGDLVDHIQVVLYHLLVHARIVQDILLLLGQLLLQLVNPQLVP